MTINDVLSTIKRKLGSTHFVLPISDEDIIDIIKNDSLPTFSSYFPYMKNIRLTKEDSISNGIYVIPTDTLNILGVSKIFPFNSNIGNYQYTDISYNRDVFSTVVGNDMLNIAKQPVTFNFYPPNQVEIFPKYYLPDNLDLQIKVVHGDDLFTIPISLKDEFIKLALIDVKASLYPILKNYDQINTPYGTINLNISDYEGMEDKRKDLEDNWTTKFMKEPLRQKIFLG